MCLGTGFSTFSFNGTKPKAFQKLDWSSSCYSIFQNSLRIFGPKMEEVIQQWRKLQNDELNDLYCSPNIVRVIKSRRIRWAGHVWLEKRGVYRVLVGKPEGKGLLERPRSRREYNIKMDLQEVGCEGMDLLYLALDRDRWRTLVSAVMNLRVPLNARNFLTS